jgi:hypothetical protein
VLTYKIASLVNTQNFVFENLRELQKDVGDRIKRNLGIRL